MLEQIKITIDKKTGEFTIEGEGYDGSHCAEDIDNLMLIIGADTISEETKPEYVVRVNQQRVGR